MSSRKIMALGKSSLIITLPKEWLNKNNLGQGDEVFLTLQKNHTLTVSPTIKTVEKQKEITLMIDTDEDNNSITRKVIGCYLNGFSIIRLRSRNIFNTEQNNAIRNVVRSLYMRIIKSSSNQVDLQTLMDESMASVSSGIERMHIITTSMCQDVMTALMEWDVYRAESVIALEDDVDQFMYFLLRLLRCSASSPTLANQLELDMVDILDYQTLVHRIERVADHTTNIASSLVYLFNENIFLPKDIFHVLLKASEIAFEIYDLSVQGFLSRDLTNINAIIDKQQAIAVLEEKITPLPYTGDTSKKGALCHICVIRDSITRISTNAADIAELAIDNAYKPRDD
ncbi:MAG: phosphate uptake regulator PhoU [Candidatus Bathyarchaeota archaeon]|nr:phosphate uptake regulator PhoU [Candidatus Bathyarchaeota archaeon]